MILTRRRFTTITTSAIALASAAGVFGSAHAAITATPDEARAIAKEAYIYGFPMIDLYRIMWAYFVEKGGKEYKGPPNGLYSAANVYTPADTAVQTPNSDTPYSFAWLDLRAEPIVLTLPKIEANRYNSVQLVDAYTYNFAYLGTRATGNDGGTFLIAGPGWKGEAPAGITKVIQAETDFVLALYRTQLFNPGDIDKVRAIQAEYGLKTLSAFAGTAAPAAAPEVAFATPLPAADERTSPEAFNVLSFILQYVPVLPDEAALRDKFATIGIGGGQQVDYATLAPDLVAAIKAGMADGQAEIDARRKTTPSSVNLFGTREFMKNDYVNRALGAQFGILGNSKDEAFYGLFDKASDGQPLSGEKSYTITFPKGQLPPAKAFWSLTMYDLPQQLLVANPINRYLVNSTMLPDFVTDADGGITFHLSATQPEGDAAKNWLPSPKGPFMVVLRIYLPEPSVLDGTWKQPEVVTG
jgi:hypothetical protein